MSFVCENQLVRPYLLLGQRELQHLLLFHSRPQVLADYFTMGEETVGSCPATKVRVFDASAARRTVIEPPTSLLKCKSSSNSRQSTYIRLRSSCESNCSLTQTFYFLLDQIKRIVCWGLDEQCVRFLLHAKSCLSKLALQYPKFQLYYHSDLNQEYLLILGLELELLVFSSFHKYLEVALILGGVVDHPYCLLVTKAKAPVVKL